MPIIDHHAIGVVPDDPPIAIVQGLALFAAHGLGAALGLGLAGNGLTLLIAPAGLTAAGFLLWMHHDFHHGRRAIVLPCLAALLAGMLFGFACAATAVGFIAAANWLPWAATVCLGWPSPHNGFDPGPR